MSVRRRACLSLDRSRRQFCASSNSKPSSQQIAASLPAWPALLGGAGGGLLFCDNFDWSLSKRLSAAVPTSFSISASLYFAWTLRLSYDVWKLTRVHGGGPDSVKKVFTSRAGSSIPPNQGSDNYFIEIFLPYGQGYPTVLRSQNKKRNFLMRISLMGVVSLVLVAVQLTRTEYRG